MCGFLHFAPWPFICTATPQEQTDFQIKKILSVKITMHLSKRHPLNAGFERTFGFTLATTIIVATDFGINFEPNFHPLTSLE